VVVARRYRPRGFDELVGQEHVGRALCNAIETSRVGHAYLFTGARGVGKTSTARIFAKALNDPSGPTPTPDNSSDVALAIDAGEDVDVIEIDGASNRGIDEIRSLRSNVGVRPSRSRYKIYIIDEVHMLTGAAFNALLKTLEEPPAHVKFIFCTTDPEKIPITVLSRCQRFDFAPVEVTKIIDRLREIVVAESAEADDDALELIARRAAGSMRDSQSLLEQVLSFSDGRLTADQVHTMLGTANDERLHALALAMADRDAAEAIRQLDAGIDAGVDAGRMAEQLLGYFRDLMAVSVGCDPSLLRFTSASLHGELKELGEKWGLQTVLAVVGLIDQTLVRIRHSVHSRVLLEAALIQICTLPDLQHIADLAEAARAADSATTRSSEKKKAPVAPPHFDRREDSGARRPVAMTSAAPQTPPLSPRPTVESAAAALSTAGETLASAPSVTASPAIGPSPVPTSNTLDPQDKPVTPSAADKPVTPSAADKPATPSAADKPATPPAADKPSSGDVPALSRALTRSSAEKIWATAISSLEAMTETLARAVERVEPVNPQTLRLVFPAESSLALRRCELPEHKTALCEAITDAAGQPLKVELHLAPPVAEPKQQEPAATRPSRMQRMREIEANPLVKSCVDLFDAEIVRIDRPR
jgi:DNA polymerase-3 subunit gamma/tau